MALTNLNSKLRRMDRLQARKPRRSRKKLLLYAVVALLILTAMIYFPVRGIYASTKQLMASGRAMNEAVKNENLDQIQTHLTEIQDATKDLNTSLNWLFWVRIIPFAGDYYADAKHFATAAEHELVAATTIVDSLKPYKDELGFNGVPTPGQDRVAQGVKVLDKVIPQLDKIQPHLEAAAKEVDSINVNKYPDSIGGRPLKPRVELAKNMIIGANTAVTQARPALEAAPDALGVETPKTYLIIFQNDKELRATGGFMTAYAFMTLDKGRISSSTSDDIYRLDERLLEVCRNVICPLTPPAPLVKYLPEADGKPRTAWSMRDSNLSPDVPTSMETFEKFYSYLKTGNNFDGIILIDTHVVEALINITGPIDVFGTTYSANQDDRCNCPNVIYELENYAQIIEKGEQDRKAILGTLMQQILARSLGASTEKLPEFINAGVELANNKHIMFYMHNQQLQQALAELNWTGQIHQTDGDYLHINDSNFAGGKSNLYVQQEVNLETDSRAKKAKLTIKYSNPQPYNTWLNGINRDYVRIYVPKGAKLVDSKGSQSPVTTIEDDLGKTVFEAFIQIRPQNSVTLEFEYELPQDFSKDGDYPLLIQKQPGKPGFKYQVKVNGKSQNFELTSDKQLNF